MSGNTGSCFCGNIKISYTGDPSAHVLCHCADCKKISGGMYSNNVVVPSKNVKLESGSPKEITKTADSGKKITSYFCPDCGTTLYRIGETFGEQHIIKSGILDDASWHNNNPPKGELFSTDRITWIPEVAGAQQVKGMGS